MDSDLFNKKSEQKPNCLKNPSRRLLPSLVFSILLIILFTWNYKQQTLATWNPGRMKENSQTMDQVLPGQLDLLNQSHSKTMDQVIAGRLDLLNKSCSKYNLDQFAHEWSWKTVAQYTILHTSGRHKVCINYKVGSVSWKSLAIKLLKQNIPSPKKDISLLTVRHPFSRLVSAYRDIFRNGLPFSTYKQHPSYEQFWEEWWSAWWLPALITNRRITASDLYLKEINILQQQLNREILNGGIIKFGQTLFNLDSALHKSFGSDEISKLAHKYRNSSISFEEFVNHVIWTHRFSVVDPHWIPFSVLCQVCEAEYNYILQLENADEEVPYVLNKIGYNISSFVNTHNTKITNIEHSYLEYFKKLPRKKVDIIYELYKYDFLFFDYEVVI